jgi:AsmA protein
LTSENIIAEIPFLRMTGKGTLNLVDEALNYRFDAKVLEAPELPNGEVLSDLTGLTIPITLKGTMDAPKAGVDLKDLGKNVAEQKLRDKLLDMLGDDDDAKQDPDKKPSTRDSLKKGLRDLLKR